MSLPVRTASRTRLRGAVMSRPTAIPATEHPTGKPAHCASTFLKRTIIIMCAPRRTYVWLVPRLIQAATFSTQVRPRPTPPTANTIGMSATAATRSSANQCTQPPATSPAHAPSAASLIRAIESVTTSTLNRMGETAHTIGVRAKSAMRRISTVPSITPPATNPARA